MTKLRRKELCFFGDIISKGCPAYTRQLSCELKWHDSGCVEVTKHVRLTSFSGASWHSSTLFPQTAEGNVNNHLKEEV